MLSSILPGMPGVLLKEINYKVDINTFHRIENDKEIKMNDIARIHIRTTLAVAIRQLQEKQDYRKLHFIDEGTNETLGAGMII